MQSEYKFLSDSEPTDEQLHFIMQEVALEVKKKAQVSNRQFLEMLQQIVEAAKEHYININPAKC